MAFAQSRYGTNRVHSGVGASISPTSESATRALPKSEAALERAIDMNTQIAESYGKCDYDSPWVGYHTARADACRDRLDYMVTTGGGQ